LLLKVLYCLYYITQTQRMSFKQSKNWCFTDYEFLDMNGIYESNKDIIAYIGWGREVCPTTKKEHYQGWIQFFKKKRLGGVKTAFNSKSIHVESCIASEKFNEEYCQKDGKFEFRGSFTIQGARNDLELIKQKILEGATLDEIIMYDFSTYCRYKNGIEKFCEIVLAKNLSKFRAVEVIYIWGKTGTGKTRFAMEQCDFKIEGYNLKWWGGYNGEKCILIDEYNNDLKITKLLNLLDGYKLRLDVKGGHTYANWNKVYITSNLSVEALHGSARGVHKEALMRRITQVIHME